MTNQGPDRDEREDRPGTTPPRAACPVCGSPVMEIRGKLQCTRCRTICETCCEGGRT
ncbi:hypothetical protein [Singulisphaera sp. PoT]|uniref:hypothetical protein n=1 Tax=Singulisphaera sp. PoT TaxID=3411797 RepID=UPI003BF51F7E